MTAPGQCSDAELLRRFSGCRGDAGAEAAFAALVRRHGPMVRGACRRVLNDPHAAEDAFQATFLTLARRAGRLEGIESLGGWLYRVAIRVALRARRARRDEGLDGIAPAAPASRSGWPNGPSFGRPSTPRSPDSRRGIGRRWFSAMSKGSTSPPRRDGSAYRWGRSRAGSIGPGLAP